MSQRTYQFERCFNFRDLGGYETADGRRVRWQRLYRSMTPQFMTTAGLKRLHDELGVRKIADLRHGPTAVAGAVEGAGFERCVIPFATAGIDMDPDTPRHVFISMIMEGSGKQAVEALDFIASATPEGAALVHCHTGKDRTGVLCALVLRLLGVNQESVLEDFALSADGVAEMKAYAAQLGVDFFPEITLNAPAYVREASQAEWLAPALEVLDASGGAHAYFLDHGATPELLRRFEDLMLEPEPRQ